MRATYLPDLLIQDEYSITGDSHHHLVHVIRLEAGENLLLLNGKGLSVEARVESITKKEVRLRFLSSKTATRSFELDLALGMPKKEALELTLKQVVELGLRKIYLIRSTYSQQKYLEADRLKSLLVSALEQSNSPFFPEVIEADWNKIEWESYELSLMMDSQTIGVTQYEDLPFTAPRLLVVGPEGGFSPQEIELLHQKPKMRVLNLPTPILRTPTAVATGTGVILQSLSKGQKDKK